MSEQKEILFQKSMTIDKRNADFAYLRRNVFPARTKGLYPAADFFQERPDTAIVSSNDFIFDVVGSEESTYDIKVIVETAAGDTNFYNLGSNTQSNAALAGIRPDWAIFGNDGVYMAADNNQVYKIQHVNGNTTSQGSFPSSANPQTGGWDGLYYWWVGNNIYKQLSGAAPTLAFTSIGITPRFVDFYDDKMVIFGENAGNIVVLFWDKTSSTLFDKRIIINNAKLIAGGVVNGSLMLVKAVGNSSNPHEHSGELVITRYDGQKFERVNSIKAGDRAVVYEENTGVGIGSEVMLFSVDNNIEANNPDLYQNYVYKVQSDGAIEIQTLPDNAVNGDTHIVRVFYNFSLIGQRGGTSDLDKIFINEDFSTQFSDYDEYNETVYITNFLNNPYNKHKLDGIAVVFEQLFQQTTSTPTGEQLNLYYRTSEREPFILLGEVTAEKVYENVDKRYDPTLKAADYADPAKGLKQQIYQITKMPDGSALPEFNEIQFKFESIRGFSVIQAWYYYSYLTRNVMN